MDSGKPKSDKRERRSKLRLSDVHRMVDKVLPQHMPDKARPKSPQQGERRGGTFRKP
jgi:hypothetical protein